MREMDLAWFSLRIKDNFSQLPYSIQILMREYYQIKNCEGENLPRLEQLADNLVNISRANGTALEIALSTIELAIIQSQKGAFHTAHRLLEDAAKVLRENPPVNEISYQAYAASYWLQGCLELARGSSQADILKCWQKALTLYEKLSRHKLMLYTGQYRYNIRQMQEAISAFISDSTGFGKETSLPLSAASVESSSQSAMRMPITLYSGETQALDVFHTIPAGPLTELEDPPEPLESIPLEQEQTGFRIGKQVFQLFRLDGSGLTINLSGRLHIALRVDGDSMNLAHIDDGDYILLRLQNEAEHEDIVAAQITKKEDDPQATLKRFERDGKNINLKAESSNPNNPSYSFYEKDLNQTLNIIGVAVGVFKPRNVWITEVH